MARIELWNGDICALEVDAIVSPAATSLWMSTGIAGEIKRAGGDAVEFAGLRHEPVALGDAILTPAGNPAARVIIRAVSLERDRRTKGPAIDQAARNAMARARELNLTSIAFPALGTGIGGVPPEEDGQRGLPPGGGGADGGDSRPGRAAGVSLDRARDLRAPRCRGVRGVRACAV